MSKIKQAREALRRVKWYNGEEKVGIIEHITIDEIQTIEAMFAALERMQGVDLSYCLKEKGTIPVMSSTQSGIAVVIDSESFKQFQNAAQTLADIKKEIDSD